MLSRMVQPPQCSLITSSTTGTLGSLQVFNVNTDRVETEHQVVERTYVSRTFGEHIVETTVDYVAFTKDGGWMATIESRDDGRTAMDLRLKLWQLHTGSMEYILATAVDPVHRSPVTSLSVHPNEKAFVTTSLDRSFKVWQYEGSNSNSNSNNSNTNSAAAPGGDAPAWSCRYVGAYLDLPCMSSSFASDGTFKTATCVLECDLPSKVLACFRRNLLTK